MQVAAALTGFTLLWFAVPQEIPASDPWAYSRNAWRMSQGTFSNAPDDHPFAHRLGLTYPVSLAYRAFGVSPHTTNLWPLVASLLLLCVIGAAIPEPRERGFGLLFAAGSVALLKGATLLFPDVVCAAFLSVAALAIYRRNEWDRPRLRSACLGMLAALSLTIAMLAKLSAFWIMPVAAGCLAADCIRRDAAVLKRFWLPAGLTGLLLGAVLLMLYAGIWGDPFSRLHAVESLTGTHLWSWNRLGASEKVYRLTIGPPVLMGGVFGILPVLSLLATRILPKRARFWSGYLLCVVLFYWFGSAGLGSFEPLPLSGRLLLPALPAFCITAAYAAARIRLSGSFGARVASWGGAALVAVASLMPLGTFLYSLASADTGEGEALEIVREAVSSNPDRNVLLVCGDERSPEALERYFAYKYPGNLTVISLGELSEKRAGNASAVFLMMNERQARFLDESYGRGSFEREVAMIGFDAGDRLLHTRDVTLWRVGPDAVRAMIHGLAERGAGLRKAEPIDTDQYNSAAPDACGGPAPIAGTADQYSEGAQEGRSRRSISRSSALSRSGRP